MADNPARFFFEPRSVAVVGASRTPGRAGHQQLENLKSGFEGDVYAVNPGTDSIGNLPCYPTVASIPGEIDLAIVLVPVPHIPDVVRSCVEAEVPAVLIPASGFAEASDEGRVRQQLLLDTVRGTRTRLWGPNNGGLLNLSNNLLASFIEFPATRKGGISIVSQTGIYALAVFRQLMQVPGYGISKVATIGNACDINEADVIEYLARDPDTKIIALHLEGVPGGARTFEVLRSVTRHKPVLALIGGQSKAGATASLSHTAGLATDPEVVRGLMDQAGVIPVTDFTELIERAQALAIIGTIKPAARVAVVSTSGAACVVSSDLLSASGLEVATLSSENEKRLGELHPYDDGLRNPIDAYPAMENRGTDQVIPAMASIVFADPGVDAALFAMGAFPAGGSLFAAKMLAEPKQTRGKPAVCWPYGERAELELWEQELRAIGIPSCGGLDSAVKTLAALNRAAAAQSRAPVAGVAANIEAVTRTRSQLREARSRNHKTLSEPQARELLAGWGIEGPLSIVATDEAEALACSTMGRARWPSMRWRYFPNNPY